MQSAFKIYLHFEFNIETGKQMWLKCRNLVHNNLLYIIVVVVVVETGIYFVIQSLN